MEKNITEIVNKINFVYDYLKYDNGEFSYLGFEIKVDDISVDSIVAKIKEILLEEISEKISIKDFVEYVDDESEFLAHISEYDALNYYGVEPLDEIYTHELITELSERNLSKSEIKDIKENISYYEETDTTFPCENLSDVYKIEHLKEIWNKYSAEDFERLLK